MVLSIASLERKCLLQEADLITLVLAFISLFVAVLELATSLLKLAEAILKADSSHTCFSHQKRLRQVRKRRKKAKK